MTLYSFLDGAISVKQGEQITTSIKALSCETFPNVLRIHIHYHPADKQHKNMSIDQILSEGQRHVSPYQPQYYD